MPKLVDHEERRARLVEAVWALAARSGLEGVTLRKVAAEAGVSMGQVQHYYPVMDRLLRDALERAVLETNRAIERRIEAAGDHRPATLLRTCLHALIDTDAEGTRLIRFAVAVLGRAMSDPATATVLGPGSEELLSFTAYLITGARHARDGGEGPPEPADLVEADICWTLATGLAVDTAIGLRTPEAARAVLDHHLTRLLGPEDPPGSPRQGGRPEGTAGPSGGADAGS
ncbi:TetR/AcrR family transcriptional regulator [Kitasatospora sp. NPDC057500]|uniref:TetR/AcrR family transcriptional regulator n=1 Tax=Kitasatospora sp. NPDC057500 TaxID=3346151 RepID=UPI00367793EE